MAPRAPQQGESGTDSSRTKAVSSYTPPGETQLPRRHHFVHRDDANPATGNITLDARLNIVDTTGSSGNMKQQQSVNDYWSCIIGDLSGHQLRPVINVVLAGFLGETESLTLPALFWIWASTERERFLGL